MLEAKDALLKYDGLLESALTSIGSLLKGSYGVSKRAVGLFLLQGDPQIQRQVKDQEDAASRNKLRRKNSFLPFHSCLREKELK